MKHRGSKKHYKMFTVNKLDANICPRMEQNFLGIKSDSNQEIENWSQKIIKILKKKEIAAISVSSMMCIRQCLAAPRLLPPHKAAAMSIGWVLLVRGVPLSQWMEKRKKEGKKEGEKKKRKKIKIRDYLFTFTLLPIYPLTENSNMTSVVCLFANQQGAN